MFRHLLIENFRRFRRFELDGLGRVNLLVGRNNSGKTTVLEAVMLASQADPYSLFLSLQRRGERVLEVGDRRGDVRQPVEVDVRRLFHGYEIQPSSFLRIAAEGDEGCAFMATISEATGEDEQRFLFAEDDLEATRVLVLDWNRQSQEVRVPLSPRGGLSERQLRRLASGPMRPQKVGRAVNLIESGSLSARDVILLFDEVALTPEEAMVVEALKLIEPSIERIAAISRDRAPTYGARGGMVVRCKGHEDRIPIGSMGDGGPRDPLG